MKTIEKDWEDPDSRLVERVCHMLSQQESPKLRDPFDAMLSHPSFVIRIYGVRGIARNGFQDLRADLRALTAKGVHRSLRSTAVAALETLGTAEEKTEK